MNHNEYVKELTNKLHDKFFSSATEEKAMERFNHSLGVKDMAMKLASIYKPNDISFKEKAEIAGLLHDYAKFLTEEDYNRLTKKYHIDFSYDKDYERVYHGYYGYLALIDELDIHDEEILNAVKNHIMGQENMSLLEEIIYVGDLIEMGRREEDIPILHDLRELALNGKLKEAVAFEAKHVVSHLIRKNIPVSVKSLECYNGYVKYLKKGDF